MPPLCQACGACCFSDSDEYVSVERADYLRLVSAGHGQSVVERGEMRFLKMESGRCAALQLQDGQFSCSIYAARPTPCRELDRGTPACLAEFDDKKRRALPLLAR